jgi:hypothetical protein
MPIAKPTDKYFKRLSIKPLHVQKPILYFSSIITEFTETWTPRWTPTNVYGRMDPVSFYNGTGRELVLGFRVISDDKVEASKNMQKIQKLIQYQYPSYTSDTGIPILTAPPYFEIKFMNIIGGEGSKIRGYVNGAIQINPGFQAKDQPQYFSADFKKIYFSDVNIVMRFTVLHQRPIGWGLGRSGTTGFKPNSRYPYGSGTEASPDETGSDEAQTAPNAALPEGITIPTPLADSNDPDGGTRTPQELHQQQLADELNRKLHDRGHSPGIASNNLPRRGGATPGMFDSQDPF